jgi:hypothetical protein
MGGSASCSWPIMLEVWVKPFGSRAVRADKDLHIRRFYWRARPPCSHTGMPEQPEERQDKECRCAIMTPSRCQTSAERVERSHHPHIGQHIH